MKPKKSERLIVGLGNPGLRFRSTRHNVGFLAVQKFAQKKRFIFRRDRSLKSFIAQGSIQGRPISLALPQTFMNCSGEAVLALVKAFSLAPKDILVVCDNVALPFGALKIKPKGSDGGHNGLAAVIEKLDTQEFARLRIGIGKNIDSKDLAEYVLSPFRREERAALKEVFKKTTAAMEAWIVQGIHACMNHFNQKTNGEEYPKA